MKILRTTFYYLYSIFEMLFGFKNWLLIVKIFLSKNSGSYYTVNVREANLKFIVRSAMDVWSLKETFLDEFYKRCGTAIENGWRVIDIGAGFGDFTLYAALDRPDTLVYAYEPFPESFAMLEENIRNNHIENVKIFAEAVWSKSEQLILDLSGGGPLQAPTQDLEMVDEVKTGQYRVPALSLEKVLEQNDLVHLDLLKLDCEGAEFEILGEKSAKILKRIERIVMEYHDGYQGHHHRELVEFLHAQGFKVRITPNYVHDKIGYLYAWK